MKKYGLNDIYSHYLEYKDKNVENFKYLTEAYATLYKMYGGKKDVGPINFDMVWYIETVERLHRAYKKARHNELEYEKLIDSLEKDSEEFRAEKLKYNNKVFDFYQIRFGQCIEYLKRYIHLNYNINKEQGFNLSYTITIDISGNNNFDYLLSSGILSLLPDYALGEITQELTNIFCSFYHLYRKEVISPYRVIDINRQISFILNHTDLKFTNVELKKTISSKYKKQMIKG